jgi:hypothetical protein
MILCTHIKRNITIDKEKEEKNLNVNVALKNGLPFAYNRKTIIMKKIIIAGLFAVATLGVTAQTGGKTRKKTSTNTTTTDTTTTMKTRGMDKGSHQGKTMKSKHRSTRSGGTKVTGNTDTTTNN